MEAVLAGWGSVFNSHSSHRRLRLSLPSSEPIRLISPPPTAPLLLTSKVEKRLFVITSTPQIRQQRAERRDDAAYLGSLDWIAMIPFL